MFLLHMHIESRSRLVDKSTSTFLNHIVFIRNLIVTVSGVVFVVVVKT